jgi:hypothetical protein
MPSRYFPAEYAEARARFRGLVARYGATMRTYVEPGSGPNGEELTTDAAWFGPRDAEAVMVLTSATHGVEGFCGSAAQIDFLTNGGPARLPDRTAALLVHAINPYGYAWLRRVTQEGCDLNRNGIDFDNPPANPDYTRFQEQFRPKRPNSPEAAAAQAVLDAWRAEVGEHTFAVARSSGQYVDPAGVHYGGTEPTWSRRTMEQFIADYDLRSRKQVAVIDYHTGLGPYGYGEPICGSRPTEPGADRGRRWYGESMTEPMKGTSTSVVVPGLVQYIWLRELSAEQLTFIALEYGTFSRADVTSATDAEQWLYTQTEVTRDSDEGKQIVANMRRVYYPDEPTWHEMIIDRSRRVIDQTMQGLAEEIAGA